VGKNILNHKGALPPCVSPGIFRFVAKAGGFMIPVAVTEDKALLGSNLSAGDGPKLAGAVSLYFAPPLPVGVLLASRLRMARMSVAIAVRTAAMSGRMVFTVSKFIDFFFRFDLRAEGVVFPRFVSPAYPFDSREADCIKKLRTPYM
jgi:hypothetical protein